MEPRLVIRRVLLFGVTIIRLDFWSVSEDSVVFMPGPDTRDGRTSLTHAGFELMFFVTPHFLKRILYIFCLNIAMSERKIGQNVDPFKLT